eukprot:scaffold186645_cov35-Tisochrysis_lutea.AAC.3
MAPIESVPYSTERDLKPRSLGYAVAGVVGRARPLRALAFSRPRTSGTQYVIACPRKSLESKDLQHAALQA